MKRFSKKSVVLFAGVMAVCAFAVPSMASAATWGPVGGNDQVLTSTNLGFITDAAVPAGSSCATASFTTTVTATALDITSATFVNCTGVGATANCTATPAAQNLPWTATPGTPVVIDRVHVRVLFEHKPGGASCAANGGAATLTGTLGGGVWSNATRTLELASATGTTSHFGGASSPATVNGTITDDVSPFVHLT
jgi:hypothetical protein